jgi:hypothetical protein
MHPVIARAGNAILPIAADTRRERLAPDVAKERLTCRSTWSSSGS